MTFTESSTLEPEAIAVYCGSSIGKQPAFAHAARSLGQALAKANRRLVYGGGGKGIMGVVSGAVLNAGGKVTGIVPYAMVAAGGEGKAADPVEVVLEPNTEQFETIIVDSMHDRKVEMAERSGGFIGLPGGFGTFEEVLEVTTWTQLGIHSKPVVLLNVLSFWEPLRQLIKSGIDNGFIHAGNDSLIVFVDGPADPQEHDSYDWGTAGIKAIEDWNREAVKPLFNWSARMIGKSQGHKEGSLAST